MADIDRVKQRYDRFADAVAEGNDQPSGVTLDELATAAWRCADDVPALVEEVQRLRAKLHETHDALTRITDADDDAHHAWLRDEFGDPS